MIKILIICLVEKLTFDLRKDLTELLTEDTTHYESLINEITGICLDHFDRCLDPAVPCKELTEGLESLYFALAFSFYFDNFLTSSTPRPKSSRKRFVHFGIFWPRVVRIVTIVLKSYSVPNCKHCGASSSIGQCLCLDRFVVLLRIVYL